MKRSLGLLLLLALLLAGCEARPAGAGFDADAYDYSGFTAYSNEALGITLGYPAAWRLGDVANSGGQAAFSLRGADTQLSVSAKLSEVAVAVSLSASDVQRQLKAQFEQQLEAAGQSFSYDSRFALYSVGQNVYYGAALTLGGAPAYAAYFAAAKGQVLFLFTTSGAGGELWLAQCNAVLASVEQQYDSESDPFSNPYYYLITDYEMPPYDYSGYADYTGQEGNFALRYPAEYFAITTVDGADYIAEVMLLEIDSALLPSRHIMVLWRESDAQDAYEYMTKPQNIAAYENQLGAEAQSGESRSSYIERPELVRCGDNFYYVSLQRFESDDTAPQLVFRATTFSNGVELSFRFIFNTLSLGDADRAEIEQILASVEFLQAPDAANGGEADKLTN